MATYINSLASNTVLIGITSDESQRSLTQDTKNALFNIGVNMTGVQFASKVSFVAQIGQPARTVLQVAPPSGSNLMLTVNVSSTMLRVTILSTSMNSEINVS